MPPTLPAPYITLLANVERPGRYAGGEINAIIKDSAAVAATIALAFPDVYDLGMSYHGFRILYDVINAHPEYAAERVYAPWPDFADALRAAKLPLITLENFRPLSELEVIGFTLQHEMSYTNVLEMLDLGGIPVRCDDRTRLFPLVVAGSAGAWSPEPLADFVDAFVLGDGEEVMIELLDAVKQAKAEPALTRPEFLHRLAQISGIYVPSLYTVAYHEDGTIQAVIPVDATVPDHIEPRRYDIGQTPGPLHPVVPIIRVAQDRAVMELRRGCVHGCRFCHAGMTNRPVRERGVDQVIDGARELFASTGDDSLTLLSLSTADYTQILPLTRSFNAEFAPQGCSLSIPSVRISSFDVALAAELSTVRKSGFTFAPEAGSDRLRRVINKPLDESDFLETIGKVLEKGWRTLKMYFMLGLPSETDADLDGIVRIVRGALDQAKQRGIRKVMINLTLSLFVPKAHTPFQWEPQISLDEMHRRTCYVRNLLPRNVDVKAASHETSVLEAVFARGDRRLCRVLESAWRKGARFDAWRETYKGSAWHEAFDECGVTADWYANRVRRDDEVFPYDHLGMPLEKNFLVRERDAARQEMTTPNCETETCSACDACPTGQKAHVPAAVSDNAIPNAAPIARRAHGVTPPESVAVQRLRVRFTKSGALRFISHLDLAESIHRILRRTSFDLAQSLGFNPQPRIALSPPLSLGVEGLGELMDVHLLTRVTIKDFLVELRSIAAPAGLEWVGVEEIPLKAPSLQDAIKQYTYRVIFDKAYTSYKPYTPYDLDQKIAAFLAEKTHEIELERKGKMQKRDARVFVLACRTDEAPEGALAIVEITLLSDQGTTLSPLVALEAMLGENPETTHALSISRLPLEVE
jgi:radical SAM family uncharacterized protein/radical SAM-linked protein